MKVTSIPSSAPVWLDPSAPGFAPQKNWKDCHVRIRFPVGKDPSSETAKARKDAECLYPGAVLHLVPDFQTQEIVERIDVQGNDEALLRSYLEKLTLPEDSTVDQVIDYLSQFLPKLGLFGVQGLTFEKAAATNVLCFASASLELDKPGLTLVSGVNKDWGEKSNGSGKSSAVTLPFLPLFGRTFKGQTYDGWARQGTKGSAVATVSLKLPDGGGLEVVRSRRPASLRVWHSGKEVTMADANQTQALIERLTNLTWDVLTNSVYIGQREIGSVFGTEKERKELFSRLLGLDRFLYAQEKLRKVALRKQRAVEETEGEIDSVRSALAEASRGADEITAALKEAPLATEHDAKSKEYEVAALKARIVENERSCAAIDPVLDENQRAFEGLMSKRMEAEAKYDALTAQAAKSSAVGSRCPTCGTKVDPEALEKYVKSLRAQRESTDEEITEWECKEAENRAVRKALIEKLQEKRLENDGIRRQIGVAQGDAAKLREQADARQRLESILCSKEGRVAQLRRAESLHGRARAAAVSDLRFAEFCLAAVGRDGLPAYLCQVAVPALNSAAARYSEAFAEGEIGIRFTAGGGDVDVAVENRHGGANVKDQSAGETRMMALIAALSFRDALVRHNVLVLDEPSEGLDPENSAAFARGLNSVVSRFGCVMVISHSLPLLAELEPDRRIEVVKENGIAHIVST